MKSSVSASESATEPQGPGESGWQARKSAATRDQIISAAIRCIVESSYSKTTTMKIAAKAGLSRGATLHHFPSKMDIIRAAVDYLHEKRLQAFRRSIRELPADADRVRLAVQSYWAHVNHPIYVAFFELSVAARTDPELREILRPAQRAFDQEWYVTARDLFPEWQSDPKAFDLALNLTQQLMEGMAISYLTHAREDNKEQLLDYLEAKLRELKPS
ncbi:TetR/AcrR family transcriptional regulator [Elongatibacter sediminis]|uniref:TetR/AcrR family transcriptional regulator n=1 Tax=Elongatibacter sediminis TaxID=3119006 RepID=UPI00339D6CB5